jgi:hypothetical protein
MTIPEDRCPNCGHEVEYRYLINPDLTSSSSGWNAK